MSDLPMSERMRNGTYRTAVIATVVAGILLLVSAAGAVRLQAVSPVAPPPAIPDSSLRFAAAGEGVNVANAVAHDLFSDDRTAPARRYRLPGEAEVVTRQPAPRPTVLGTAVGADDTFAICQAAGAQPRVVRVGGKVGEFVVIAIERSRVRFRGPDGEQFAIDASKPVP